MSSFREKWIDENVQKVIMTFPDEDPKVVRYFVEKEFDNHWKDHKCIIYNNYEKEQIDTTLGKATDWIMKTRPILTESGSMFKQHHQAWNPDTAILQGKLDERKIAKNKKFDYKEKSKVAATKEEKLILLEMSDKYDLTQRRVKVIVNSEYGVSGLSSSWFFNMACASATTARGQALISTAETAFEDFLADNVLFMSMDECLHFICNIVDERPSRKLKDDKWVSNKNVQEVTERLVNKFIETDTADSELIMRWLSNLSQENLNRIYYKSNMDEFFRNSKRAQTILRDIVASNISYLEPMKPPAEFKEGLDKMREAVLEYVHYNHPTTDRVYRLKTHMRKRVIVIDTDSNFINMGSWVDFVEDEIMSPYSSIKKYRQGYTFISARDYNASYTHEVKQQREFRIINSMVYIITKMINDTLETFMIHCYLEDLSRNTANMKNEFLYDTILITDAKKHYQSVVRIQEGRLNKVPELDIKGMEYTKPSMASSDTRQFIQDLVYKDILMARDMKPDISAILNKLRKFENSIRQSIMNGDYTYFKTANIKTGDAYESPFTIGTYKAAYTWNYLCPDKEIELPGVAYIAKVNIKKLKDVAHLSTTFPDIYSRFEDLFNLDVHMIDKKTGQKKIKKYGDGGIANIAIPLDSQVPEWLKSLIDTTEIIENNTRLILPVLSALGLKTVYNSKGSQFFSNIIEL